MIYSQFSEPRVYSVVAFICLNVERMPSNEQSKLLSRVYDRFLQRAAMLALQALY